jgi:hypothetical protein
MDENLISITMIMPVSEGSCNMTMEGSYCPEHGLMPNVAACMKMAVQWACLTAWAKMWRRLTFWTRYRAHIVPEPWEMRNKEFDGLGGQGYWQE